MKTEKKDDGRRDTSRLSLDAQNEIAEKIYCIKGVLELLYMGAENLVEVDGDNIKFVIMDAEKKLDEVSGAIDKLTAA